MNPQVGGNGLYMIAGSLEVQMDDYKKREYAVLHIHLSGGKRAITYCWYCSITNMSEYLKQDLVLNKNEWRSSTLQVSSRIYRTALHHEDINELHQ